MGIFSRLTDIINSNINAILDKAENPEKIIRMVIQEMEDTLVEVRSSAASTIADQKDIERKLKRLKSAQDDWQAKAELAISKGREDLAKGALVEKRKVGEMVAHLDEELTHLKEALSRHEEDVVKLDAKLAEARAKKASIDARTKTATNHVRVRKNLYDSKIKDAFDRFDKVESRLDRIEGEAESLALGRGLTDDLSSAFAELETIGEIEKELEELVAQVTGKSQVSKSESTQKPAAKKKPAK